MIAWLHTCLHTCARAWGIVWWCFWLGAALLLLACAAGPVPTALRRAKLVLGATALAAGLLGGFLRAWEWLLAAAVLWFWYSAARDVEDIEAGRL